MKIILKTVLFILFISKIYGQGISIEPNVLRFNPVLSFRPFNATEPSLDLISSHSTFRPSLSFRHFGNTLGWITGNSTNDLVLYARQSFRFETLFNGNFFNVMTIQNNGSVGIGVNPSVNAKLDVDGNIRSSSLDFTEQSSTERRLIFTDANGVIRADNSTDQYQSYGFSAVQAQDWNDQLRKGSGYAWFNSTNIGATMYLPVNLPDGVKVTNVRLYFLDDSASDLIFTFSKNNHSSNAFTTIASAQSSGANTNIRDIQEATNETIQNQSNSYYLNVSSVGNWIGNNLRFHSFVITYQYQ
ncbi:MAG: hypothetical protein MUF45_01020 [Spirosomaceae bacterium]|jgi:hypothetical protein|nr:hypothetical protein [Spirosomataceae bacterium]